MEKGRNDGNAEAWCPFEGIRVVSQKFPFGDGVFFQAADSAGRPMRLIAMPPGRVPPLGDEVIASLREAVNVVRPLAFASTATADYWLTEWPGASDLLAYLSREDLDPETKRQVAGRACVAVQSAANTGLLADGAINPAAIFLDAEGKVKLDGVGMGAVVTGYQQQRLDAAGRNIGDYLPRPPLEAGVVGGGIAGEVRGLGLVLFELYAGAIPRGSFFAMPSEATGFEPRLDDTLMTAIGLGPKGEIVDVEEIYRVVNGVGYGGRPAAAPAYAPVEDPDQDILDMVDRQGGPKQLDGMFSWMPNWIVIVAILAGVIGAAAISFVHREREKLEELAVNIDPAMRMLDEAEQLFELRKRLEALQKIATVAEGAPISEEVIARMAVILTKENEYDAMMEHGGTYSERAEQQGGAEAEALLAVFKDFEGKFGHYNKAMSLAERVAALRDQLGENVALRGAAKVFPQDREAARRLAENPLEVRRVATSALDRLREQNPSAGAARWKLVSGYGGVRLDLSGNPGLLSVAALEGQPLRALDLSDTGVRDLWPLETMPLRSLKLDRTRVRSLGPVVPTPISDLSFTHSEVMAIPFLNNHPTLVSYRGHSAGKLRTMPLQPAPGVAWSNTLGQRFVALRDTGIWFGEHEVRVSDFREFVRKSGDREGATLLEPLKRGWQRSRMALAAEQLPMSNVSKLDAQRFCAWLTEAERQRGLLSPWQRYRLPSDFEWSAAAGLCCVPFQDPRSRDRQRLAQSRANRSNFDLIDIRGHVEPSGTYPLSELTEQNIAAVSAPAPVRSFFSRRAASDLATGVREWLDDSWGSGDELAAARGMSWKGWAEFDPKSAGADPLLEREPLKASAKADDLGFRLVLEDMSMSSVPSLAKMVEAKDWDGTQKLAERILAHDEAPEVRKAAASTLAMFDRRSDDLWFGKSRYRMVWLPLRLADARALCAEAGGELAVPRDDAELEWMRRKFLNPSRALPIWWGDGEKGKALLATAWPAAETAVASDERHPFVIRLDQPQRVPVPQGVAGAVEQP